MKLEEMIIEDERVLEEIVRNLKTIVVVGMKDETRADQAAYQIPAMVQKRGIRVIPVNPTLEASLGEKALSTIGEVEEPFDAVNVFRRSEAVGPMSDEILALPPEKRPRVVWMQTGVRNEAAAKKLAEVGIRVVMDRCLGVYVTRYRQ